MKCKKNIVLCLIPLILLTVALPARALEGVMGAEHGAALTFLWIAIILFLAKISSLVERFGQPSVLGELLLGVFLGNLALVGIHFFVPITGNETIAFLAKLGVVILL